MLASHQQSGPTFGRKADSYDKHAHVQSDAAAWLTEWLPETSNMARCLEMGAGTGLLTQHLAGRFAHLESSDISSEMLEICQQRVPGAICRIRDAWQAPTSRERWDVLASSSLLQWAPCPLSVMQQWAQLVRPNGRLILGFFAAPSLPEMMEVIEGDGPVAWRSPKQWQEVFRKAGYTQVRMEAESRSYSYPSALDFWKSLHGTGATVSRRIKPSAMLRFLRNYEASFKNDAGVYATWTFCRVELLAPSD